MVKAGTVFVIALRTAACSAYGPCLVEACPGQSPSLSPSLRQIAASIMALATGGYGHMGL